ncbi:hypothetical protein Tco_0748694 [Tanacetum coccineum]|uniref:Uncharacterized protein n=1 Tax=Tanacetum coccineum TaxID=301880 RepID=A0ABQ4YWE2_9ASTR
MVEVRDETKKKYTEATDIVFDGEYYSLLAAYGPNWIRDDRWQDIINRVWNNPKWREKSRKVAQNRNTKSDGSVGKHTCGSATMTQHKLNKISVETYKEKLLIKHRSDKSLHPVGDIDLWLDCSGGKVKGRTFGTSSLLDPQFLVTGMPSTPSTCRSHHEGSTSKDLIRSLNMRTKDVVKFSLWWSSDDLDC